MDPEQQLAGGVQQLKIQADDKQLDLLLQHVQLLQKWNQTYNLTAIEDTVLSLVSLEKKLHASPQFIVATAGVVEAAAGAYDRYQKCGIRAARRLFWGAP